MNTDHSYMIVLMELQKEKWSKNWHFNQNWLKLIPSTDPIKGAIVEFFEFNKSSAQQEFIWEAFKAYIRGILQKEISIQKRIARREEDKIKKDLDNALQEQINNPTIENKKKCNEQKNNYEEFLEKKRKKSLFLKQQLLFEEGGTPGKLLAQIVKPQTQSKIILSMINSQGLLVTSNLDVIDVFQKYYIDLYGSRWTGESQRCQMFLEKLKLPNIEIEDKSILEAEITLEEVNQAILDLPPGKVSGNDGIPIEIYRLYSDILAPELLKTYKEAFSTGKLPKSMNKAVLKLIPKEGKNPRNPESYRPISLLNSDIKILAKILATRLGKIIGKVINKDQTGFMPMRSITENIRRVFLNLQTPVMNPGTRALFSLDIVKAFDTMEWPFLWETMGAFGFGDNFIRWVKLLYNDPSATLQINNIESSEIRLHRGTRQGCPLSPMLFALVMETLAEAIRKSEGIRVFLRKEGEEKITQYADDTLLFLGDIDQSLDVAICILEEFGTLSGLKISEAKSALMLVDHHIGMENELVNKYEIKIVSSIKYLGILIEQDNKNFIINNLSPLINRFKENVKTWNRLPLPTISRIAILKMKWLPQLLYIYRYILGSSPVWIPSKWFKIIESLVSQLIWRGKKPRIKLETLKLSKAMGGMDVPDFKKYFIAAQVKHLWGWGKIVKAGEIMHMFPSKNNHTCIEILESRNLLNSKKQPTYKLMEKIWLEIKKNTGLKEFTKYTNIWNNKSLIEFSKLKDFSSWRKKNINYINQIVEGQNLKTFEKLRTEYQLDRIDHYRYIQLKHAFVTQFKTTHPVITTNKMMEEILDGTTGNKGIIGKIYKLLNNQKSQEEVRTKLKKKWGNDIGEINNNDWENIFGASKKVTLTETQRITHLYYIYQTYYTPIKLFKWKKRIDSNCPKCGIENANWLHMVWECPKILSFWYNTWDIIINKLNVINPLTPKIGLLGLLPPDLIGGKNIFVHRCLFVARRIIAKLWMATDNPTIRLWENEMIRIIKWEAIIYKKRGNDKKFWKIWEHWKGNFTTEKKEEFNDMIARVI